MKRVETASPLQLIHSLTPRNLLSFGSETAPIELSQLNVLIGPNGSGKSNLLEVLALLRAAATDFLPVIAAGGGVAEWIWKGYPARAALLHAVVRGLALEPTHYDLAFRADAQSFRLFHELIQTPAADGSVHEGRTHYVFVHDFPRIMHVDGTLRAVPPDGFDPALPIMGQRRDPETYPTLTHLATQLERIRLYREWTFGRKTILRKPQAADARNDRLAEDFSNLGMFLGKLRRDPPTKRLLLDRLRDLYEGLTDFEVITEGGTVQVFFTEGDFTIPATRLSDGSLRYLCLLAILCDPSPPPLICIEEPELGLHLDLIPKIADLLVDASSRTQLIVTTHSDVLVDALSERPDAILVCEKHEGQTTIRRLDPTALAPWLAQYRLGQLWTRGEIGGTRW